MLSLPQSDIQCTANGIQLNSMSMSVHYNISNQSILVKYEAHRTESIILLGYYRLQQCKSRQTRNIMFKRDFARTTAQLTLGTRLSGSSTFDKYTLRKSYTSHGFDS